MNQFSYWLFYVMGVTFSAETALGRWHEFNYKFDCSTVLVQLSVENLSLFDAVAIKANMAFLKKTPP